MKQKTVENVIWVYKIWSSTLFAVWIILPDYKVEAFWTWWISTAILGMYLLVNTLYLVYLKKKISDVRMKEIMKEIAGLQDELKK